MYYVGKLDLAIYSCIASNIVTDEVIITDERIQHIKERHPGDLDKHMRFLADMIKAPDYILAANKPNTAVVLKEFRENGKSYKLILRLKTSSDPGEYKNSVITFQKVENRRYIRYTKSNKVLYKSEYK